VTRIAFGLPVGGDLEYADEVTLAEHWKEDESWIRLGLDIVVLNFCQNHRLQQGWDEKSKDGQQVYCGLCHRALLRLSALLLRLPI